MRRPSDYSVSGEEGRGTIDWLVFAFLLDLGVTHSSWGLVLMTTGEPGRGVLQRSTSIGIGVGLLAATGGGFLAAGDGGFFVNLHAIFHARVTKFSLLVPRLIYQKLLSIKQSCITLLLKLNSLPSVCPSYF